MSGLTHDDQVKNLVNLVKPLQKRGFFGKVELDMQGGTSCVSSRQRASSSRRLPVSGKIQRKHKRAVGKIKKRQRRRNKRLKKAKNVRK